VKKQLEITLVTLHSGSARTVVTLDLGEGSDVERFLLSLYESDPTSYDKFQARFRAVAEHDRFENKITFRSLKGHKGLFEFKIKNPALRIYAFYDHLPDMGEKLIITACASDKSNQTKSIKKAAAWRSRYLEAKKRPDTILHLKD